MHIFVCLFGSIYVVLEKSDHILGYIWNRKNSKRVTNFQAPLHVCKPEA